MHMKKTNNEEGNVGSAWGGNCFGEHSNFLRLRVCACVCVFVCARARACVCVVCARGVKTLMSRAAFFKCVFD